MDMWPNPLSHIQMEWQVPEFRRWYERLAENRKLVRYDGRGSGLSDRGTTNYSLDAQLLDLDAVVKRLGLERFALLAVSDGGPAAIAYAARHPEQVSHLILWCTSARVSDMRGGGFEALESLLDANWELYTETFMHVGLGWSEGEEARRYAALMREYVTPDAMRAFFRASANVDVTDVLPHVTTPTLVLQRRGVAWLDVDIARGLATRIPDARLALLEGESAGPYLGDMEAVATAIDEFLSEGEETAEASAPLVKEDIHTILFTDMEGSTALTERLGDARAQELRRTHDSIVRDALKAQGGSETKHTGDGIMASFPSASRAIGCAVAVQRAIAEQGDTPLRVRIGLNAGEPVAEEADLFGTAVNLARRICDHAEPGQILVSDVVQQLAAGKGFVFADMGEATLKGFEKPVRLHEVRWQD
jgi:class 3 adenylate cyclase